MPSSAVKKPEAGQRTHFPCKVVDAHSAFKIAPMEGVPGGILVRTKQSEATVFPNLRAAERAIRRTVAVPGTVLVKPEIRRA